MATYFKLLKIYAIFKAQSNKLCVAQPSVLDIPRKISSIK